MKFKQATLRQLADIICGKFPGEPSFADSDDAARVKRITRQSLL